MKYIQYLFLSLLFCISSCTKKPKLEGFDLEKWQADKGGCKGDRVQMIEQLKALKQELKGVSSNDMEDYLGKPDIQQLADRNQEYYVYFLDKGTHCEDIKNILMPRQLQFVSAQWDWPQK
ncbi:hypothetical protein ACFFJX_22250 [Pseudarcicella hirudinis]|uniref:hypothetical protein n=1 Tax=Pseudarcicella hirudinis TaxID=1079859 RepID=UPI0035E5192A